MKNVQRTECNTFLYLLFRLDTDVHSMSYNCMSCIWRQLTEVKVTKDISKNTPAWTFAGFDARMMARGSRRLNPGVWLYQSMLYKAVATSWLWKEMGH